MGCVKITGISVVLACYLKMRIRCGIFMEYVDGVRE